jgi:hypothetical protein
VRIISLSVMGFIILLGISSIAYPALFDSYIKQFLGISSPVFEVGGYMTPTAYLFLWDLAGFFIGNGTLVPYFLDLVFIGAILVLFFTFYRRHTDDDLRLFSLGVISLFLLIPRLKPNYFVFILVPIYLLVVHESDLIKTLVVIIAAIIPFICLLAIELNLLSEGLILMFVSYNQLICALTIFLLIIWLSKKRRKSTGFDGQSAPPAIE